MYLGPNEIKQVVDLDGDSVNILLVNGDKLVWSKSMYEYCATEQVSDLTTLGDARLLNITQKVVKVFLDEDITIDEIETVMPQVSNFLTEKAEAANALLWRPHMRNNPEDKTLSGLQVLKRRTLRDLDSIFTFINEKSTDTSGGQSDTSSSEGDSPDSGDTKG